MNRPVLTELQSFRLVQRAAPVGVQYWGVADGKPEGSNGGFLLAGQDYSPNDRMNVYAWLADRARGYPRRQALELWPCEGDLARAALWAERYGSTL